MDLYSVNVTLGIVHVQCQSKLGVSKLQAALQLEQSSPVRCVGSQAKRHYRPYYHRGLSSLGQLSSLSCHHLYFFYLVIYWGMRLWYVWLFSMQCLRSHKSWIVIGRFHVKGPRKKVNVEKWIFFNEMWKVIGQIDDFNCFLNNSFNLGVFLAKNKKYPKITVLKKWKLKKRRKIIKDWKNYAKYHT